MYKISTFLTVSADVTVIFGVLLESRARDVPGHTGVAEIDNLLTPASNREQPMGTLGGWQNNGDPKVAVKGGVTPPETRRCNCDLIYSKAACRKLIYIKTGGYFPKCRNRPIAGVRLELSNARL